MRYANEVTVEALQEDREFLRVYLANALVSFFHGEQALGCLMLRDIVNATIGFPKLAQKLGKKDKGKGLMQMLTRRSNPTVGSFFSIIGEVLKHERLEFAGASFSDRAA